MSVSQKTQFHGVGDDKKGIGNNIYGTKVSSEISYAIRRQREISGVDYLKAKVPTQTDKNVIASKISNVSLDGYFPFSIYSQLKTDKSQTRRTKKGGKFASLNRSKSSVSLSLPSGRNMSSGQGVPHSVVVTDLTCLQLADTLFSSNLASSLGLSSQSTDKLKYTNIPSDKRNLFIGENDKSLYTNVKNNGATSSIPLPALNSPGRSSHPKKDPQRPNSSTGVKTVLHPTIVNEKEELSPKSILKQTSVEKQPEVNSKGPKYRTLSDKAPKKNTCPETPRCITVKASKIGLQSRNATVKNCTLDFDDKDKRSVRFNVSHEIFEFAPYDPVNIIPMAFKDKLPKHGLKLFGFLVIFGIFCGVIYILARFMSPSHRCRPPSTPLALQPIIHFRPIVENVQTVTLKWQSQKVVNGSEFVTYNPSTNNFIVEESNILNIRMTFHVDIKHLTEDKLNVACLVYSDEKQKCKAVLFRKGHNMGELHVQDKIFALPGYKFSVSILDPSMINTNSHGNSLIVVKSFDSGHEVNNSTAKCKDKDKIS